jgi:hypothetical protein
VNDDKIARLLAVQQRSTRLSARRAPPDHPQVGALDRPPVAPNRLSPPAFPTLKHRLSVQRVALTRPPHLATLVSEVAWGARNLHRRVRSSRPHYRPQTQSQLAMGPRSQRSQRGPGRRLARPLSTPGGGKGGVPEDGAAHIRACKRGQNSNLRPQGHEPVVDVPVFVSPAPRSNGRPRVTRYTHTFRAEDLIPGPEPSGLPRERPCQRTAHFQAMFDSGPVRNRADLARTLGCSRARVTKVLGSAVLKAQ